MGRAVMEWLTKQGWEMYQEVSLGYGDARADLVGKKDGGLLVVECKMSMSIAVLDQALMWKHWGYAHLVAVAVPSRSSARIHRQHINVTRALEIGLMEVHHSFGEDQIVSWHGDGYKHEAGRASELENLLHPLQNHYGKVGTGEYFTAFRLTCDQLVVYVRKHPGCTMAAAVEKINHHYASDKSAAHALGSWVGYKHLTEIEWGKDGKLHPVKLLKQWYRGKKR